jgi:Pilus formation protein N terminal region
MACCSVRRGPPFGRTSAFALALGLLTFAAPAPAPAADIDIVLDQAKLLRMPDRISTIVIGNPLIADATLQAGGMMVITGKGYGMTNIIALDRTGNVLLEKSVEVRGPNVHAVVVYRGIERESLSCAPVCERRVTLGDSGAIFDTIIGQIGTRNGAALGAPPAASK